LRGRGRSSSPRKECPRADTDSGRKNAYGHDSGHGELPAVADTVTPPPGVQPSIEQTDHGDWDQDGPQPPDAKREDRRRGHDHDQSDFHDSVFAALALVKTAEPA
jgi:hypothetical protein